jgi:hypothetical protein
MVDEEVKGMVCVPSVPSVKVCTPVEVAVTILKVSPPVVDVASVCDATVEPLSDVIVPPAPPASTPQVNVPLAQRSFSVDELQDVKLAPKSEASVSPPVDEAFVK